VNVLIHTCDYTIFIIHRYTVGSFLSLAKTDASVSAVQLARQVFEVCCSVLQRVVACCSVLQTVAECCSLCGAT